VDLQRRSFREIQKRGEILPIKPSIVQGTQKRIQLHLIFEKIQLNRTTQIRNQKQETTITVPQIKKRIIMT
jgi:hypothetical protein